MCGYLFLSLYFEERSGPTAGTTFRGPGTEQKARHHDMLLVFNYRRVSRSDIISTRLYQTITISPFQIYTLFLLPSPMYEYTCTYHYYHMAFIFYKLYTKHLDDIPPSFPPSHVCIYI